MLKNLWVRGMGVEGIYWSAVRGNDEEQRVDL